MCVSWKTADNGGGSAGILEDIARKGSLPINVKGQWEVGETTRQQQRQTVWTNAGQAQRWPGCNGSSPCTKASNYFDQLGSTALQPQGQQQRANAHQGTPHRHEGRHPSNVDGTLHAAAKGQASSDDLHGPQNIEVMREDMRRHNPGRRCMGGTKRAPHLQSPPEANEGGSADSTTAPGQLWACHNSQSFNQAFTRAQHAWWSPAPASGCSEWIEWEVQPPKRTARNNGDANVGSGWQKLSTGKQHAATRGWHRPGRLLGLAGRHLHQVGHARRDVQRQPRTNKHGPCQLLPVPPGSSPACSRLCTSP